METDSYPEAVINELRTAQKCLKRAHRMLILLGFREPDDLGMRFIFVICNYIYDLVAMVVDRYYASSSENENTLFPKEEGCFQMGVRDWLENQLHLYDTTHDNHPF